MLKCLLRPILRESPRNSMTSSRAFSTSKYLLSNYYEILKLSPNATSKEIKEAYFKLSKENHPDLNPNDPGCHDRFIKLQEAYKILSNPNSRKEYDVNSVNKRNTYYNRDARYKPDFSARDEWIRRQNERYEKEMKYGEHFGHRQDDPRHFNSFYSKPRNMTPEEMKIFLRRKKIVGQFNPMSFVLLGFFIFVTLIMSESYLVGKLRRQEFERKMRENSEQLKEATGHYYADERWLRDQTMRESIERAENLKRMYGEK